MPSSRQRRTAEGIVAAYNIMDIPSIMSYRSPDCVRYILPSALGLKPYTNDAYLAELQKLSPIFNNFSLTAHDVIEDKDAHRISMRLTARGDTLVGEYVNEYVWMMTFDDSGEKLVESKEFVDAMVNKEFWPKLQAEIDKQQHS